MNRPFYAFGVLLVLLALAMAAVSSSSRSTSVQTQPKEAAGSLLTPNPSRGTNFVVVLPAPDEGCASALQPCTIQEVPVTRPMTPTIVRLAEFDAGFGQYGSADCLSHHDRAYDELIYGTANCQPATTWSPARPNSDTEEILAVFHSLARRPAKLRSLWRPADNAIWLGLRNWALRPFERWLVAKQSGPAVEWSEYSRLMNSLATSQPANIAQTDSSGTVRSGGWLLHFAVSSLSRIGLTLQQAATELERTEFRLSPSSSGAAAESTSE